MMGKVDKRVESNHSIPYNHTIPRHVDLSHCAASEILGFSELSPTRLAQATHNSPPEIRLRTLGFRSDHILTIPRCSFFPT